jgi:hypothetical protein
MAEERKYVKIFCDALVECRRLKDAEFGRLIRAALEYKQSGEEPELTGNEAFLWDGVKMNIDRATEAYQKKVEANRENGQKGGRPAKPSETQDNPENPVGFSETQKTQTPQDKRAKNKEQRVKSKEYMGDIPPVSPPGFDRFWNAYPKKTGKGAALQAFKRINGVPIDVMLFAIEQQRHSRQWQEDNGRFIPNPATWLNQRRWEDEPEARSLPQSSGNIFADLAREFEQEEQQHDPF